MMPSLRLSSFLLLLVLSLVSGHLQMVFEDEHGVITFSTGASKLYKLHPEHLSWDEAEYQCKQENGDLTVIRSDYDAQNVDDMFNNYITDSTVKYISVGISDRSTEGSWMTVDGVLVSMSGYNVWAPGEPGSETGDEDCGVMDRRGQYSDVDCANQYPFICELRSIV